MIYPKTEKQQAEREAVLQKDAREDSRF